ncbi:MAG: DUF6402 family protein [Enterobacteriaceae bacterium]|jgi:hypothetical protein|nr:DUF6402 family protein [Enterobacteriaceae bacterium]
MGMSRAGQWGFSSILGSDAQFVIEDEKTRLLEQNSTSVIDIKPLEITEIPAIMRKMGWKQSAKLMERWFNSPAWEMPVAWKNGKEMPQSLYIPEQHCDDQTIKMSWALEYPRIKAKVDKLTQTLAYNNSALELVVKRLKALGWDGTGGMTFGRRNIIGKPSMSARELDQTYQNNYLPVGIGLAHRLVDTIDDMYGSLGALTLKVALLGTAFRDTDNQVYLDVDYAGVYLRDTFDFINDTGDDQPLGVWTEDKVLLRADTLVWWTSEKSHETYYKLKGKRIAEIHNSDFHRYREKNNKGGDFVIFSDVYWLKQSGRYKLPWDYISSLEIKEK